jgi:sugar-specific transcriptional regulator TrmB
MNIKQSVVKQLRNQLAKIDNDIEAIKLELSNKQKELNFKRKMFDEIRNKIENIEKGIDGEICISEHAFLRYFERVLGYDLDQISKDIITDKVKDYIEKLGGSGTYPTGKFDKEEKEYRVTLKNNIVVTMGI